MRYKLSIESNDGEMIEISDPKAIKEIQFYIHRNDNYANDPLDQLEVEVIVDGFVFANTAKDAKAINDWFRIPDVDKVYRTVSIQIYPDNGSDRIFRDYYLKSMYCYSYLEKGPGDGVQRGAFASFHLEMKQLRGETKTVVIE